MKTKLSFCFLAAFFLGACCNNVVAQVLVCGSELASYRGVAAKYNGQAQGTGDSCANRGSYGLQYQCVEYIKRFYSEALSFDTTQWRLNAVDFFGQASQLGLTAFANVESTAAPRPDDILVFGGTKNNPYGHVAIVAEVSGDSVICIEQNWSSTGIER